MHSLVVAGNRPVASHSGARETILAKPYHNLIPTETSCRLSSCSWRTVTGTWTLRHAWQTYRYLYCYTHFFFSYKREQIFYERWRGPQPSWGPGKLSPSRRACLNSTIYMALFSRIFSMCLRLLVASPPDPHRGSTFYSMK